MQLLVDDWLERLNAEQRQRSADLMQAALGSDWEAVDARVAACNELETIRTLAVALADRLGLWGRGVNGGRHEHGAGH